MRERIKALQFKIKTNLLWYIAMLGLFVVVFIGTFKAYAWLSTLISGDEEVTFETGTTSEVEAVMWMFDTKAEGAGVIPDTWVKHSLVYTDVAKEHAQYPLVTPYISPAPPAKNLVGKFETKSLHLGTIDNLTKVKDDNIVYFRFKINAAENGKNLSMNISHGADYLTIYGMNIKSGKVLEPAEVATTKVKKDGQQVFIPDAVKAVDKESPLLVFEYALANFETEPGLATFNNLNFTNTWTSSAYNSYSLTKNVEYTGDYYLYVKISPKLEAWGLASKYLYSISPCQLLFDWDWLIEVY